MNHFGVLPPNLVLDTMLRDWLLEDIGRGDRKKAADFGTVFVLAAEAGFRIPNRTLKH